MQEEQENDQVAGADYRMIDGVTLWNLRTQAERADKEK